MIRRDEEQSANEALASIFANGFPWEAPFAAGAEERMIVGLVLDELFPDQFGAVSLAAQHVDDSAILLRDSGPRRREA